MESSNESGNDPRQVPPTPRRPYEKPRLEVYGDLRQISRSVVGIQGADGAGHPNKHFTR